MLRRRRVRALALFLLWLNGSRRVAIGVTAPSCDGTLVVEPITVPPSFDHTISGQVMQVKKAMNGPKPKLLAGGNPQIAKADGDAPVQAYVASMPGWKRDAGRRLDALIVQSVPQVQKAVKWNSPFYGVEGKGWFLSFHCFTRYVKVTFFRGTSLRPPPPGESKHAEVRYLDIYESEPLDEKRFVSWVRQAAKLPGWTP